MPYLTNDVGHPETPGHTWGFALGALPASCPTYVQDFPKPYATFYPYYYYYL